MALFRENSFKMESPEDDEWNNSMDGPSNFDVSVPWDPSHPREIIPAPAPLKKSRARSTKNRSHFLRFFIESTDPTKMRCALCTKPTEIRYVYGNKKVTSSMRDHLLAFHPTELTELLEGEARHDQARRHLLRSVVTGILPFSSLQNEEIRLFVRCLDPSFPVPDDQVLLGSVLKAEFDAASAAVRKTVGGQDVALTVDEWTRGDQSMVGLTAHLIDAQWTRHILVVSIDSEDGNEQKQFEFRSLTARITDRESESAAADEPTRIGCILRACQLFVSDSISSFVQGKEIIERIREVAVHLHRSTSSWNELKTKLASNKWKEQLRIPVDSGIHWRSMMRMMRVADGQMSYLDDAFRDAGVSPLDGEERLILHGLVAFLEEVDDFASKMSTHNSTLSSLIPYIKGMEETIAELKDGPLHDYYPHVLEQFTERLAIYREQSVARRAYLLDPRFLHLSGMLDPATRTTDLEMIFQQADEECGIKAETEPVPKKLRSNLLSRAVPQSPIRPPSHAKREYDVLFDLCHSSDLPEDADPCVFWREHEAKFPRLAPIARRLLAIPPSSIHLERFFSALGHQSESEISLDSMKKLLFVRAFLKKEQLRLINAEEYNDFFSEQQRNREIL